MWRILCYGHSNTWGYDPATQDRLDRDARWPGVLRSISVNLGLMGWHT